MTEIIAECGINAAGSEFIAEQQIYQAFKAGANAVKFQVYNTDRLYKGKKPPAYKDSKRGEFSYDTHKRLAQFAKETRIEWFASVFDEFAVDLCEEIGVKRYKIASRSVKDEGLLKKIRQTNKPVIISIKRPCSEAKKAIEIFEGLPVILLYCVPNYPTQMRDLDFMEMRNIHWDYKLPIGFSDHTQGIWASLEAVRMGATIIEKHFTISRLLPGCDQICSIEPSELDLLIKSIKQREEYEGMLLRS